MEAMRCVLRAAVVFIGVEPSRILSTTKGKEHQRHTATIAISSASDQAIVREFSILEDAR